MPRAPKAADRGTELLLKTTRDGFWIVDLEGRIREVNDVACEMLRYSRAELLALRVADVEAAEDSEQIAAHIQRVLETGFDGFETRHRRKDGSLLDVQISASVLRSDADTRLFAFVRDISEQKRAQEALRLSEERYRLLVENSPTAIFVHDSGGTFRYVNAAAVALFGTDSAEQLLGRNYLEFVHPQERDAAAERMRQLTEGKPTSASVVRRIVRPSGEVRFATSIGTGFREGEAILVQGMAQDITEALRREQLLRESDAKFRAAFHASVDPIVISRLSSGLILDVNEAYVLLTGYRREELIGKTTLELGLVADPDGRARRAEQAGRDGHLRDVPSRMRTRDGEIHDCLQTSYIIEIGGEPTWVSVLRDVTESRRAERALRESEERLRQAVRVSDIGIFDHDHRTDIIYWSPEQRRIYCWGPDEPVTLQGYLACVHPEDLARVVADVERAHDPAGDGRFDVEHRIVRRDGEVRWLATRSQTYFETEGGALRPVRTVGAVVDITERKRVEGAIRHSASLLAEAQHTAHLGNFERDLVTGKAVWSDETYRLLGYEPGAVVARMESVLQVVHPDDRERFVAAYQRSMKPESGGRYEDEHRVLLPDGSQRILRHRATVTFDQAGRPVRIFGTSQDITEARRAEQELRLAASAFESHEGIFITDNKGVILRANRAFTEMTRYSVDEVVGRPASLLNSDQHDPVFSSAVWAALDSTGSWQGEVYFRGKNGELYPTWASLTEVKSEEGQVTHYVCHFQDISERKQVQARVEHLAYHDPLTHLPNRSLLLDRLQQALARNRRRGLRGALLFMDLDGFKNINDSLGHPIGDLLLCEVGNCLVGQVREEDTVARLGGDEFVVLLAQLEGDRETAAREARTIADKIHAAVSRNFSVAGYTLRVGASIGAVLFPDGNETADDVLRHADIAMYRAKAAGRGTVCFFSPEMQSVATERLELEGQLRQALEKGELTLHFQPQVEIATGRIVGAESLMRWTHPQRGAVSPDLFVPVLEESGLILSAGDWVLRKACQMASTAARSRPNLKIAVNVSPRQLHQTGFIARVRSILSECSTRPECIELEITENAVIQDIDDTVKVMSALKDLGFHFSLDDFGTGYSSLSHVKRLPLDTLKIDRAFVRDCTTNPNDAAIVRAIIAMARSLDLNAVAEGVEHEAQRRFLQELGCGAYQGFLFSPPVPEAQFLALVNTPSSRHRRAG